MSYDNQGPHHADTVDTRVDDVRSVEAACNLCAELRPVAKQKEKTS